MRSFAAVLLGALSIALVSAGPTPKTNTHVDIFRRDRASFDACLEPCIEAIAEDPDAVEDWEDCYDSCADEHLADEVAGDCDPDDLGDKDDVNECIEDCADEHEGDEDAIRECVQECTDDFCDDDLLRKRS